MKETFHLLVVDDEETVTRVVKRTLEVEGYKVTTANTGNAALEVLENLTPDLVLLDINMPGLNGYQTLERIKEHNDDIPVIMLTAVQDVTAVDKSLNLGADDYIRKPFRSGELVARVKARLRRAGLQ
jgi:DNA-binding response OmpR family regulator